MGGHPTQLFSGDRRRSEEAESVCLCGGTFRAQVETAINLTQLLPLGPCLLRIPSLPLQLLQSHSHPHSIHFFLYMPNPPSPPFTQFVRHPHHSPLRHSKLPPHLPPKLALSSTVALKRDPKHAPPCTDPLFMKYHFLSTLFYPNCRNKRGRSHFAAMRVTLSALGPHLTIPTIHLPIPTATTHDYGPQRLSFSWHAALDGTRLIAWLFHHRSCRRCR